MSDAYKDGWYAHLLRVDIEKNPFDYRYQPYSQAEWRRGWCARFDAVKHDLDLSLDQASDAP